MPRIRTIKPEFPQSESLGGVSRDARLLFILLWTQADDAGRLRGAPRMLASILFPYDDDAKEQIERWLGELAHAKCIRRYEVDGTQYIDIPKWLQHQKIDKPSPSKFPPFEEGSRGFANVREGSGTDLDLDQGKDQGSISDASHPHPPGGGRARKRIDYPASFEEFWSNYPKRESDTKSVAFKAWDKARKAGVSEAELLNGAMRYAAYLDASGDEPAHVQTWVNREGWTASYRRPVGNRRSNNGRASVVEVWRQLKQRDREQAENTGDVEVDGTSVWISDEDLVVPQPTGAS
jgi:hypothetical protein